jgi:hypothetical protein
VESRCIGPVDGIERIFNVLGTFAHRASLVG